MDPNCNSNIKTCYLYLDNDIIKTRYNNESISSIVKNLKSLNLISIQLVSETGDKIFVKCKEEEIELCNKYSELIPINF